MTNVTLIIDSMYLAMEIKTIKLKKNKTTSGNFLNYKVNKISCIQLLHTNIEEIGQFLLIFIVL